MTASSCSLFSVSYPIWSFFSLSSADFLFFPTESFLKRFLIFVLVQWPSCSTGLASSCLSVWPPRRLAATGPSRALASPSSNGFSSSGYVKAAAQTLHTALTNPWNVVLCRHKTPRWYFNVVSLAAGLSVLHCVLKEFFIQLRTAALNSSEHVISVLLLALQFSTYFPGYFDGQYWLWWVFLVLGK